ncbi:hypothetical protein H0241_16090 [Mesorhizobium sp. CCANP35]|uniref:Uncharacterized protein n=1 Tax=Mesorhizobium neociceri TaxID=1307853 RepID=A0A838B8S3_9HYPH|nr:hypothetical protein [Mesorhizobium neociceri]
MHAASVDKGKIEAGVHLPPLPDDCRTHEAHAPDPVGAEAIVVLKAERKVTNRANARTDRCAANYDNVAAGLAGQATP